MGIQQERTDIILEDVNDGEYYGMGRSFRRSADSRALNTRVLEPVNITVNIWRKIEQAKRNFPRLSMLEHYDDVVIMMEIILQLSNPM